MHMHHGGSPSRIDSMYRERAVTPTGDHITHPYLRSALSLSLGQSIVITGNTYT